MSARWAVWVWNKTEQQYKKHHVYSKDVAIRAANELTKLGLLAYASEE